MTDQSDQKGYRIICFGDSLTYGWLPSFVEDDTPTPYANVLKEKVPSWEIIEAGCPGETARHMIERLPKVLDEHPADMIIILGGTNDLGKANETGDTIFESLKTLHKMARERKMWVVMLSIPRHGLESEHRYNYIRQRRLEVNTKLFAFAAGEEDTTFIDFATRMKPYYDPEYWSDWLHFTPKGYEYMGEIILEGLLELNKISLC